MVRGTRRGACVRAVTALAVGALLAITLDWKQRDGPESGPRCVYALRSDDGRSLVFLDRTCRVPASGKWVVYDRYAFRHRSETCVDRVVRAIGIEVAVYPTIYIPAGTRQGAIGITSPRMYERRLAEVIKSGR